MKKILVILGIIVCSSVALAGINLLRFAPVITSGGGVSPSDPGWDDPYESVELFKYHFDPTYPPIVDYTPNPTNRGSTPGGVRVPLWTNIGVNAISTSVNFGRDENAFLFDGVDDCIYTISNVVALGAIPRTVMFWAKQITNDISSSAYVFSWGGAGGGQSWHMTVVSSTDTWRFYDNGAASWVTQIPLSADWQHVALSYDGTTLRWYIDGQFQTNKNWTLNTALDRVYLGQQNAPGGPLNNWAGWMDDPVIVTQCLTEAAISNRYWNTRKGNWSNENNY